MAESLNLMEYNAVLSYNHIKFLPIVVSHIYDVTFCYLIFCESLTFLPIFVRLYDFVHR